MAEQHGTSKTKTPAIGNNLGAVGAARFAPGAKPKDAKGTIIRLLKIYMRWGKTLILAVLITICSSLISVLVPLLIGKAFNTFQISTRTVDFGLLQNFLLIIILLYLASWFISTMNGVITLRVSKKLVFVLREEFFEKMQRLPLGFYDTYSHGDTMSRITNDVDNISSTIAQATTQLISSFITLTGSLIVMIILNVPLTIVILLNTPFVFLITRTLAKRSHEYFKAQKKSLGMLNGSIVENIMGQKMVKVFGKQQDVIDQFEQINEELCKVGSKALVLGGYVLPLMNVLNNFIFTVVAFAGGVLSVNYGLSIGTVVSFLSYSMQFSQPLSSFAGMFNTLQSALAGAERVFEIMDIAEETPDAPDAIELQQPKGDVVFEHVNFFYDLSTPILKDVSFSVKAGEVVALVGETGAGKTTIVNLLTRFYDAQSGEILIDNTPINKLKRTELRKCFSVVLQDTCLFTGTIMDNIRYSQNDATDEEVIAASRIAHAHDFVSKLPKGYYTMVSGANDTFSQGQRQLIAIARAVLCDSPILILDEATSSVDTKTEKNIQRALLSLMKNRTSFLIAHRLSTIRDADNIMVIGGGRILESGDHKSLMERKGPYYEMVISQMGKTPNQPQETLA